jgi:hypothetical protein
MATKGAAESFAEPFADIFSFYFILIQRFGSVFIFLDPDPGKKSYKQRFTF